MTETLINAILFILLAGGVAWYLYEQRRDVAKIRRYTGYILNIELNASMNIIIGQICRSKQLGDQDMVRHFEKALEERMRLFSQLECSADMSEFIRIKDKIINSVNYGQQDDKQENG